VERRPHPLGDAFQSFHVLVQPLYTSIYFPGTALINVPMVWLHLPHWLIPLLLSGIAVGLVYWNVSQLADGYAAAGCVVLLLGCNVFRSLALMLISQPIMLFLGMVLVALWLQWRHRTGLVWALLLGVVGGLSLIVRPVEALAYCLPIGVAMLWQLGRRRMGRIAITLLLLIVPTIPFVALQIIHNKAITGKALRFASDVFVERYYPGPMVGFSHYDPRFIADTPVVPLREAARSYVGVAYRNHTRSTFFAELWSQRLSRLVYGTMPNVALALLFVIGCAAIGRQQRWVLWAALPLSSLFYVFYVFYIMHYPSVVQPAVGLAIMLSAEVLRRAWPRYRDRIAAGVALAVATAALTNLPQFGGPPDHYNYPQLERINAELAKIDHKPALVIFEFGQYAVLHEEPVYNQDVLWPDDAEVVRVHDLGPELNLKTLEYYAAKQPQRTVYWFSRPRAQLGRLGNVVEVARAGREKLKPPPASSQAMPMPSKVMPTGE
jgi:4-amino-4-deoxy-L-arabinose transferase-like glycosyltransferase